MTAALIMTATDRNETSNSSIESSTTPPMRSGIRLAMLWVLSIEVAVTPPTCTLRPPSATASGRTSSRSVDTRSSVAGSCGPSAGITVRIAASPDWFTVGGVTAATPWTSLTTSARRGECLLTTGGR